MNDNLKPSGRAAQLTGRVLADSVVLTERLTTGLDAVLAGHGVAEEVRGAVKEFVQPLLDRIGETERAVVRHARDAQATDALAGATGDLVGHLLNRIDLFAEEVGRLARTPEQFRLAETFRAWAREANESWFGKPEPVRSQVRPPVIEFDRDGR